MADTLRTAIGKALYGLRKGTVEPVSGMSKEVLGFRQCSWRGQRQGEGAWTLVCVAFDVQRLHVLQG
jgi:hypothetical protein